MKISLVLLVGSCTFLCFEHGVSGHGGINPCHRNPGWTWHHEKSGHHDKQNTKEIPQNIKNLYIRKADKTCLEKQKQILTLLYRLNQNSELPEHIEIAKNFSPFCAQNITLYLKEGVIEEFHKYWRYGPLAKGAIFSIFEVNHLQQAIALSRLLFFAKDYEIFYKTASWARQNVNEGLFVYSLYVAVVHRSDTKEVMLPPLYEITPHLFFSADVINKAKYYKQIHDSNKNNQSKGYKGYTIDSDYSSNYSNQDDEQSSLAYYLEDIGVNSFFRDFHNHLPFWMNGTEFGWSFTLLRGRLFYLFYQYIWARYQLERISLGLDDNEYLNWDLPVTTPFTSNLQYPNGIPFPSRPKFAKLHEYFYNYGQSRWTQNFAGFSYSLVNDFERRIADAIESGAIWSESENKFVKVQSDEFLNVLGNLIETNRDSPNSRYYGPIWFFARYLLGYSIQTCDQNKLVPSALEHYETSLRDPVFYKLIKKLVVVPFQRYLSRIPPYTETQLLFPGVEITKVKVDPLITFNEPFYSDLINSVFYKPNEPYGDFLVRIRQNRLNHAPFEIKLNVKSDKPQKASVKVLLGPKYDSKGRSIGLCQGRLNFVLLDHFTADLKSGDNIISRKSSDNEFYVPDKVSFSELYKNVEVALKGERNFTVDLRQNLYGYPQRFVLPRGSPGGTSYQLFFAIYPFDGRPLQRTNNIEVNFIDNYSVDYPLDRFIKFDKLWEQIPNFRFEEVKIYFQE
ncbi:hexamerin 70a-like [Leptinotarsa decemlineata]|uniref:hexamerin 70a-like n=1 Tax=Leptinotarsa decemlineata TaxID=7539 RepID=UPI003D30D034